MVAAETCMSYGGTTNEKQANLHNGVPERCKN